MEKLENKWEKHPALHLDLNAEKYDTIESLKAILSNQLTQRESIYRKREDALQQINEKDYAAPFKKDKRKLIKVGVEFSAETRNVKRWLVG